MLLVTHNMLKCNIRGVEEGYPLKIEATEIKEVESEFDIDRVKKLLERIQFSALKAATKDLKLSDLDSVDQLTEGMFDDEELMKKIHHVLFEIHVQDGNLICPETGRKFPIKNGIPNMLLNEDEV